MTNFDYLKSLSTEDFAKLITYLSGEECDMCSYFGRCNYECNEGRAEFLNSTKNDNIDTIDKFIESM